MSDIIPGCRERTNFISIHRVIFCHEITRNQSFYPSFLGQFKEQGK